MFPKSFTTETLKQLEVLSIKSKRKFLGRKHGGHVSLKRGHGIEFSDYRKYEIGDDPRHIDWKVFARSDRLYVKQFQEEQDLAVFIILDASPSMFVPSASEKWERARALGLALAYIALFQQDTVKIVVPGVMSSSFVSGAKSIKQLAEVTSEVKTHPKLDFAKEAEKDCEQMSFPGIAILISDFLMPIDATQRVFDRLRSKNLDLLAIEALSKQDLEPFNELKEMRAIDSESGAEVYLKAESSSQASYELIYRKHLELILKYFSRGQIAFSRYQPSDSLLAFISENLQYTGLFRWS